MLALEILWLWWQELQKKEKKKQNLQTLNIPAYGVGREKGAPTKKTEYSCRLQCISYPFYLEKQ